MNIENVENNVEKGNTYKTLYSRYKKAIKNEFYFESLVILYAIAEDKCNSILKHLGITTIVDKKVCIKDQFKNDIRLINTKYKRICLLEISYKIELIKRIIEAYKNKTLKEYNSLKNMEIRLSKMNLNILYKELDNLSNWKNNRNEIIHSLTNLKYQSVQKNILSINEEGFCIIENISKESKKINKYN